MEKSTSRLKVLAILVAFMFAALTRSAVVPSGAHVGSAGARIVGVGSFVGPDATRTHLRRSGSTDGPQPILPQSESQDQLSSDDARDLRPSRPRDYVGECRGPRQAGTTTTAGQGPSRTTCRRTSSFYLSGTGTSSPVSRWFRRRFASTPTARWRRTSWAGWGRSTRRRSRTRSSRTTGRTTSWARRGWSSNTRGSFEDARASRNTWWTPTSRSSACSASSRPFRGTTSSSHSTSTRSASPSRR